MPRYQTSIAAYGDTEAVVLRDDEIGSEARIAPAIGCNVFSFSTRVDDRTLELLSAPADAQILRQAATGHGIPVMIPYPGRVRNGRFQFRGRDVTLPLSDGQGHAIHGCVRQRAWKVAATSVDDGASVTCMIGTADYPEMLLEWPWAFSVKHTTSLQAGMLQISLVVTNESDSVMPLGVGLHPYFRAPIGSAGVRDRCLVRVEATHWWEQDRAFPTGRIATPRGVLDLRTPRPLGDLPVAVTPRGKSTNELYTSFGPLSQSPLDGTGIRAALFDPEERVAVQMTTSDTFRALVLFTPTWTQSVSLEPHTCVPDAFNVEANGISAGVMTLDPGQTWSGWARFAAQSIEA